MLPQFNNQNTPVTPNNGNPNTIYNQPRKPAAFEGFSNYETIPDSPLDPVYNPTDAVTPTFVRPIKSPERYVAPGPGTPVGGASLEPTPMTKLPVTAGGSAAPIIKPNPVSVGGPDTSPGVVGPSIPGEYLRPTVTQPEAPVDKRTTMGQWLPRFAIDTSSMGTQFGPSGNSSLDYWRSRLAAISSPQQTQQPEAPVVVPTKPVVTPAQPSEPTQPVNPTNPVVPVIRPSDPVRPGQSSGMEKLGNVVQARAPWTNWWSAGSRLSQQDFNRVMNAIQPSSPAEAEAFAQQVANIYNSVTPEQRAEIDADIDKAADPATPMPEKVSILQRIKALLDKAGGVIANEARSYGNAWRQNPVREIINIGVPGLGDAVFGRGGGTVTVGNPVVEEDKVDVPSAKGR